MSLGANGMVARFRMISHTADRILMNHNCLARLVMNNHIVALGNRSIYITERTALSEECAARSVMDSHIVALVNWSSVDHDNSGKSDDEDGETHFGSIEREESRN